MALWTRLLRMSSSLGTAPYFLAPHSPISAVTLRLLRASMSTAAAPPPSSAVAVAAEHLRQHGLRLTASEASALQARIGADVPIRPVLVAASAQLARPAVSRFHVGCVVDMDDGALQCGVNLEFAPSCTIGQSIHGEQFAMVRVLAQGRLPVAISISHMPCGHCRQFMNEITGASSLRIQVGALATTLAEMLPHSFSPSDIPDCYPAGVRPPLERPLAALKRDKTLEKVHLHSGSHAPDAGLLQAALDAACRAHAPYTGRVAGVAIALRDGRVFSGSYIENAAFNPSVPPLQAALIHLVSAAPQVPFADIAHAVLVQQRRHAVFDYVAETAVTLRRLAPTASLAAYSFT